MKDLTEAKSKTNFLIDPKTNDSLDIRELPGHF